MSWMEIRGDIHASNLMGFILIFNCMFSYLVWNQSHDKLALPPPVIPSYIPNQYPKLSTMLKMGILNFSRSTVLWG